MVPYPITSVVAVAILMTGVASSWLSTPVLASDPGRNVGRSESLAAERPAGNPFVAKVAAGGNTNLFHLTPEQLALADRRGRLAWLDYPATDTTLGAPYDSINRLYGTLGRRPLVRRGLQRRGLSGIGRNWSHVFRQAGLINFPREEGAGAYFVPFPGNRRPSTPMGFTVFRSPQNERLFTMSCAACHTRNLFGRPVLGGSNLHGGTGNTMLLLKRVSQLSSRQFRFATRPDCGEARAFYELQRKMSRVQGKRSQAMGLENPVAFVGLSMWNRAAGNRDAANRSVHRSTNRSTLHNIATDTKPPVLWNLKYKNRFQHDGSMTGDPILANLIFNEIGRGSDLKALSRWIDRSRETLRDMAAAAYAMQAPRWTDFFAAETIDLEQAKRGEIVFNQRCARCHGAYEKAWSRENATTSNVADLLRTVKVTMPSITTAEDVGTDPGRSRTMLELAPLANRLSIFKDNQISFRANPGAYVPPPLVGIWARWPYMHNNSIPNLDELLKPAAERVTTYYVAEAIDIRRDYDARAVGFKVGPRTPQLWRTPARLFDTRRPGLANTGHDEGIFVEDGVNQLSPEDKSDLIEFLKTL